MTIKDRVRNLEMTAVYDGWAKLSRATYDYRRSDGIWQTQQREIFDCGHGATILPYDPDRRMVILTRQFRFAAFSVGEDAMMIEAPAGLLDGAAPEERIRAELEEETGYRISQLRKVFTTFMSPGAFNQMNHCFVGRYGPEDRVSDGGGCIHEGEDIEVMETDFDAAMAMIDNGTIVDGKTIMLLQYAALHIFPPRTVAGGGASL